MSARTRRQPTVLDEMATYLREADIALDDEAACLRALSAARFLSGDIIVFCDTARQRAREGRVAAAMEAS